MFLTKKGLGKILLRAICCLALGSICVLLAWTIGDVSGDAKAFWILGAISYTFCLITIFCGYYTEGKANLINLGNKLVRMQLKPADFVKAYVSLENDDTLVVKKPDVEVLHLLAIAYGLLGDIEKQRVTICQMIDVANDKKKTFANLVKVSFLFAHGETEKAETLFNETQKQKLDIMCSGMVDGIFKMDRAMAMGDYKTVENFACKTLERPFPKPDNLEKLMFHYKLGEVYEKMQNNEKAVLQYQYCAENGGETALKISSSEKLQRLEQASRGVTA